jgi:hypothetical protein
MRRYDLFGMAKSALQVESQGELADRLGRLKALVEAGDVEAARSAVRGLLESWPSDPEVRTWATVLAPPKVVGRSPAAGYSLERIRLAVDPGEDAFYFGD